VPIRLNVANNSLKNDPPASEKTHGPDPVTFPVVEVEPWVPLDASVLSITMLPGGPPSMKSKAGTAVTPLSGPLPIVTSITVPCAKDYYWWRAGSQLRLYTVYDKDERDDLTPQQRNTLKAMLKAELEARRSA
jgi:hypothetical protein